MDAIVDAYGLAAVLTPGVRSEVIPAFVPWLVVGALILLAAVGLVGWILLRRRQSGRQKLTSSAFEAWQQAACPVCLALDVALVPDNVVSRRTG